MRVRTVHGLALIISICAAIPYTPVQLLTTGQNNSQLVYIIDPPASVPPHGQLRVLKPTQSLSSSLPAQTLSPSLPFFQGASTPAYEASADKDGNINVVVSNCSSGVAGSSIWTYTPNKQDDTTQGAWAQKPVSGTGVASNGQTALNYLAQSITFAPTNKSNSTIYTFGGMCPFKNATDDNWVSAASYSNQLVVLSPDTKSAYGFQLGTAKGQPIAEAGFSITALSPSFTNNADGSQGTTQSFLLLGGQTHDAFINTSQVALITLPQASWTFLSVGGANDKSDLKRDTAPAQVEPRSGHTAVLTSDGSKVVMLGGWVGDISSPAEPQLAILNVGAGFGGPGPWTWADQPSQPSFPAGSSGIYGHGAVMLDGDVLMVYGGNPISAHGTSTKAKRATPNAQAMFYNVTSNQWVSSYDYSKVPGVSAGSGSGGSSSSSQSVGLGVGLSFGFVAIFAACWAGYMLLKKSQKYKHEQESDNEEKREREIIDLSETAHWHQEQPPENSGGDIPGNGALAGQVWDGRGRTEDEIETEPGVWVGDSVRDAERTGYALDIPSPQRGLRRSLAGRANQPAGRHIRRASGSTQRFDFDVIEEEVEEDGELSTPKHEAQDPFRDPDQPSRLPTRTPPPSLAALPALEPLGSLFTQTMSDMNRWISDLGAMAQERASSEGRPSTGKSMQRSPEHEDRTLSNLSDVSSISRLSGLSALSGISADSRTGLNPDQPLIVSPRSPIRLSKLVPPPIGPFAVESPIPSPSRSSPSSGRRTPRSGPLTGSYSHDGESFTTAPSFSNLQAESDALLGPVRPGQAKNLHLIEPDEEPTFTRANGRRAPSSRIGGWVGSVRRVIQTAGRSTNLAMTPTRSDAREGRDGLGGLMVYETRGSATSSPTKKGGISELQAHEDMQMAEREWQPQRSASDGAGLFSAKRGAKDWGVEPSQAKRRRSTATGDELLLSGSTDLSVPPIRQRQRRSEEDEEDWDVERAVEDRNVQIMFSVPKERLRVVNADVDAQSISDAEDVDDTRKGKERIR